MGGLAQGLLGLASGVADVIPGLQPVGLGLGLADSALGAGDALAQQNAQNRAAQAAQQNQSGALGQVGGLAQNLAQGPSLQSLIDAEGSGIKTLQSTIGGVANPAALIKQLMGNNLGTAIDAGLNNRSSNLQGAVNALLNVGSQYGTMGQRAAGAATANNPFSTFAQSLAQGVNQFNNYQQNNQGGGTGLATGAGSLGGNYGYDVPPPAPNTWSSGVGGGTPGGAGTDPVTGMPFQQPGDPTLG